MKFNSLALTLYQSTWMNKYIGNNFRNSLQFTYAVSQVKHTVQNDDLHSLKTG